MSKQAITLRPPLPPPLSHNGILFLSPLEQLNNSSAKEKLPDQVVAAIAAALVSQLPPLPNRGGNTSVRWLSTGIYEGVSRWRR